MINDLKSIYIDCPRWDSRIKQDDFVVAIGKTKSNSVYHVAHSRQVFKDNGVVRNYLKVFVSDLITALKRDPDQQLITLYWYPRDKKKN